MNPLAQFFERLKPCGPGRLVARVGRQRDSRQIQRLHRLPRGQLFKRQFRHRIRTSRQAHHIRIYAGNRSGEQGLGPQIEPMQVSGFARLTGNQEQLDWCRNRLKTVLIPDQMAQDGSFPLELKRAKPYSYSIFNLDAMATVCQILSTKQENLWQFELPDGRGLRKAVAFLYPYIKDKKSWPYPKDVMYFDDFPVRQPSLVFAGVAYHNDDCLKLWRTLNPDPTVEEVIRNMPIRQPALWL